MTEKIEKEIQLPSGKRLVLLDWDLIEEDQRAKNVQLLDSDGHVLWKICVLGDEDTSNDQDPFTNIYLDDKQQLRAYRWDGFEYIIDVDSGETIRDRFLK